LIVPAPINTWRPHILASVSLIQTSYSGHKSFIIDLDRRGRPTLRPEGSVLSLPATAMMTFHVVELTLLPKLAGLRSRSPFAGEPLFETPQHV
jgi:hypothetical protein